MDNATIKGNVIQYLLEQEQKVQDSYGVSFEDIAIDLKIDKEPLKVVLSELFNNKTIRVRKAAFGPLIFLT